MGDNRPRVLTHIPMLRIAEEAIPFAGGTLRQLPFDEFDYLLMGSFSDSKPKYESTRPLFLRGAQLTESTSSRPVECVQGRCNVQPGGAGRGLP